MNNSVFGISLGFVLGVLFLASVYPTVLGQYTCPDFLSIETCEMSTYHALIVDIISTSIFTGILAYLIYNKTINATSEAIRIGIGSLSDRIRIDVGNLSKSD